MQWLIHVKTPAQTCFQNTELTLEMFRKISTSSCHQIPNELSNLLALVATCSTQTVNQNTNVPAEVCKVPIKRTCGLTVSKSKIEFLNPKESENGFWVSLLNRSIHDLLDHGMSKELKNPLPEWILWFL